MKNETKFRDMTRRGNHTDLYEKVSGESATIPNQALTVKEILERFTKGVSPEITKNSQYTDTEDFDDYTPITMEDLTDLTEARLRAYEIREQLAVTKAKNKAAKEARKKADDSAMLANEETKERNAASIAETSAANVSP